jgi:hypothetical protein
MNTDENPLETALRVAIADPALRPTFYQKLLESDVYVLSASDLALRGNVKLDSDLEVSLKEWKSPAGSLFLPFFTSLDTLQRSIKDKGQYVGLPARTLFEITRGKTLFLNPMGPYGKEFFPNEIDALLATDVGRASSHRIN